MWWVLNYYGHTNARVLNGGWERWFHEGRPISREVPSVPAAAFTPATNDSLVCSLDYGKARVGDANVIYLDVRSDGEWTGENSRGNKRIGRVPGAIHLEWTNFMNPEPNRSWKSAEEIRALLDAAGVTPDKEVITY